MSARSKTDDAWEKLFETHGILERVNSAGICEISISQISRERDPRFMTRFDHRIQLPSIFKKNQLTIAPRSRSTYVIGHFSSYFDLPKPPLSELEEIAFPATLETINPQDLYSESATLMCAHKAGMLASILNEDVVLTVTGAMSAGRFNYSVDNLAMSAPYTLDVENAEFRIVGGFEGPTTFSIVEVTNETVDDFHIPKLYFPYRLWMRKTRKQVVPIFLSYSNDVFSLCDFRFTDALNQNSIEINGQRCFQIESNRIELSDIVTVASRTSRFDEPQDVPFPQADNFFRVVDLLSQIQAAGSLSQEEITANYAFDPRQTQYYATAGIYLNLIERTRSRDGVRYELTHKGSAVMSQRPAQRSLALVESMLQRRVFHETVSLYLSQASKPAVEQVVEIMRSADVALDRDGNTTMHRRAQTVLSWIDWMIGLTRD